MWLKMMGSFMSHYVIFFILDFYYELFLFPPLHVIFFKKLFTQNEAFMNLNICYYINRS